MRSTLRVAATTLALTGLLTSPLRANVLVVDASGAGAFTQISAAVAVAADGDVILVKSGTYNGFSIVDKALDVVADVGATAQVQGGVSIANLSATRTLTLTALRIDGTAASLSGALRLIGCTGSIRVQGCAIQGFQPACGVWLDGGHAVEVGSCADVAFANCTMLGGAAPGMTNTQFAGDGGRGLTGSSSMVAVHDCTVTGGDGSGITATCGPVDCCNYGGYGADGARFTGVSSAFFARSSVLGGSFGQVWAGYQGCSGSGIVLIGSAATTARALESVFSRGADGGFCIFEGNAQDVRVHAPSTFTQLTGLGRRMSASRVLRELQPARVDFFGQPGDAVRLVIAEAPRFVYSDAWRGVSLVARPHPSPTALVGTIPASGALHLVWVVPDLGPGVQSRRYFLQAEFVDPTGQKTVSTPATLVLVDSTF